MALDVCPGSYHAFQAGNAGSNPAGDTGSAAKPLSQACSNTARLAQDSSPRPHHRSPASVDAKLRGRLGVGDAPFPEPIHRTGTCHEQVVYFIESTNGLLKVGTTLDLPKRLVGLRAMSPLPLRLVWWVSGGKSLELAFHAALAPIRSHGEWFLENPHLLEMVAVLREDAAPCATCLWVEYFFQASMRLGFNASPGALVEDANTRAARAAAGLPSVTRELPTPTRAKSVPLKEQEKWPGGYVRIGKRGRVYMIAKEISGVRFHRSTRCSTLEAAMVVLERLVSGVDP